MIARFAALVAIAGLVEIVAVSQFPVFGANATLAPLVVMAVGLVAGASAGALTGFAMGLFLDLALVQTLGVSSLLLVGIGHGAGRLRELRNPQGALLPLAAGAAATTLFTVGYAVIQFLLGVDAPVSLLLLRDIVSTIVVNALIAAPVFALTRRWLTPVLPDDPRRRRRRAYTTGGLSPLSRA